MPKSNKNASKSSQLSPIRKRKKLTLEDLPVDLIESIGKRVSTRTLTAWSRTNKRFHAIHEGLATNRAAKQLMEYILYPTPENIQKAKDMYINNPKLLFIETYGIEKASGIEEYTDAAGKKQNRAVHRKVIGTPFGAALGTGDSTLYNDMASVVDKIEYKDESGKVIQTGVQRALEEIKAKFPDGFGYPPCDANFNAQIQAIVGAITQDQTLRSTGTPSEATQTLIAQFRKEFIPKDITQGHHFNLNYLIKALETYSQNWESWCSNQFSLFWRQVIGYLERLVPVVDAQAFCQGLYYLLDKKLPQDRSLSLYNFRSSSTIRYFGCSDSGLVDLGFDFAIEFYGARSGERGAWCNAQAPAPFVGRVIRLCGEKTSDLENLQRGLEEQVWALLNNRPG